MFAVAKMQPAPGVDIVEVDTPKIKPGHVKVEILGGSICGTDLHIHQWDAFSQSRIHPPRIIGHEFCGEIIEVGEGVDPSRIGEFISSESHIVCGTCRQCQMGQGHVCANTRLLGIDVDGGFGGWAVMPAQNARTTPRVVPHEVASMLDALGNAVHTVADGPVAGQTLLITGMGPIGLFSIAVAKAWGAEKVIVTEVRPYRKQLAEKLGADVIIDPTQEDADAVLSRIAPDGVDGSLEMSGHESALPLAIRHTRPGGRISLLGLYPKSVQQIELNAMIMRGLKVNGIIGRKIWETWDQMIDLLQNKNLDVSAVVTHKMDFRDVNHAMEILERGEAGKVVLDFSSARN
ncbi:MAG: L-threonine 3-dehydrogenase [Armatimonadetes bacterium]|nr:L-threonine 3-dehydrogenase [Armatimonadota bacterium]